MTVKPRRVMLGLGAAALALLAFAGGGAAFAAATAQPAIQTSTPRSERDITNIDVLRQQIRNYYGDPLGTGVFADDSNYAKEARSVAVAGKRWLGFPRHLHKTKAIVLDVDDTTWPPGTTRSSATGRSTRRPTGSSSPSSASRPCRAWSIWPRRPSARVTPSST